MMRWAVTGPAGGGKSTLCGLLADRGAVVIDGDRLGHEILARPDILERISQEFGDRFVTNGQVDRGALGNLVFRDATALACLNGITLAPIGELAAARLDDLALDGRYRLAVLEAAVYFLFPPVPEVDLVVTVTADPEVRIARMIKNRSLTREQALARMRSQRSLEPGWAGADIVLNNDGSPSELEAAVEDLWARLDH